MHLAFTILDAGLRFQDPFFFLVRYDYLSQLLGPGMKLVMGALGSTQTD